MTLWVLREFVMQRHSSAWCVMGNEGEEGGKKGGRRGEEGGRKGGGGVEKKGGRSGGDSLNPGRPSARPSADPKLQSEQFRFLLPRNPFKYGADLGTGSGRQNQKNSKRLWRSRRNPAAFPKARPIFQQPFSLPESAQTLAGIAFRACWKIG